MNISEFAQGYQAAMQDIASLGDDIEAIREWVANNSKAGK